MHRIFVTMTLVIVMTVTSLMLVLLISDVTDGYVIESGRRGGRHQEKQTPPVVKTNEDDTAPSTGQRAGERGRGGSEGETREKGRGDAEGGRVTMTNRTSSWRDRLRPPRFHGQLQVGPGLSLNASTDFNWNFDGNDVWWRGRSVNGKTTTTTVIRECCPGFQRENDQSDCTEQVDLLDVASTLEQLTATEMLRALSLYELTSMIGQGNYTVFAPTNQAFDKYKTEGTDLNVVVVATDVSSQTDSLNSVILSHLSPGFVKISAVNDDDLIGTELANTRIRINKYHVRGKKSQLVTANCLPVQRSDVRATNGVVHLIDGFLSPVKYNLKQLVQRNPLLSNFSKVLEKVDLNIDGHYTLFAPTNEAIERLTPSLREKMFKGTGCGMDVVKEHLLGDVICSKVIQGRVRARNILDHSLRMSRGEQDDDLEIESANVLKRDIMATNGVLYIIDQVIVPEGAEDILVAAERIGATKFLEHLATTGLDKKLRDMNNFTVFLPTNDALEIEDAVQFVHCREIGLSAKLMERRTPVGIPLDKILQAHIIPSRLRGRDLYDGQTLTSVDGPTSVHIKTYHPFFSALHATKTVQCSRIIRSDIEVCGGIIHIVEKAILPSTENVVDMLSKNASFSQLSSLIQTAGLQNFLKDMPAFTIFAPTNQAFDALPKDALNQLKNDSAKAKKLILSHIISVTSAMFTSFESNLDGWMVPIDRTNSVTYGTVPVRSCDQVATNGVVHAVERFIPSALTRYGLNGRNNNDSVRRRGWILDDIWSLFD